MVQRCRRCGAEISFGESSTAAICPRCGKFIFSPHSQPENPEQKIPPQNPETESTPVQTADASGANDSTADAQYDPDLTKRVEAWEQTKKKRKKLLAAFIAAAVLLGVCAAVFYVRILPILRYRTAMDALKNGDYPTAISRFDELQGFRDADKKRIEAGICLLADAQTGDTVVFGRFDQDNDPAGGKEDVQWRVLAREQDRLLLITQSVLDAAVYNTADQDTTWETCTLREWLNSTFLTTAFSESEQRLLQPTTLPAQANPCYPTNPGNSTTDRVFLLGIEDVQLFFMNSDSDRIAVATESAIQRRIVVNETTGGSPWWVRTPGKEGDLAAFVRSDGIGNADGTNVNTAGCGVRPAVWVDVSDVLENR